MLSLPVLRLFELVKWGAEVWTIRKKNAFKNLMSKVPITPIILNQGDIHLLIFIFIYSVQEALDTLRQEHHSFAYPSSVFYILLYKGTINTHSSNSLQRICQAAGWQCITAQDRRAPVRNHSSSIWWMVMHRTGVEVNARQSSTRSVCWKMEMQFTNTG